MKGALSDEPRLWINAPDSVQIPFARRGVPGTVYNWRDKEKISDPFSRWLDSEGILPLQFRKACEIRIGGDKLAAVFDGKSSQVGIRNQIADGLTTSQHLLEDTPMPLGWLDYSRAGLLQPTLYAGKCLAQRERVLEDSGIASYPNKRG